MFYLVSCITLPVASVLFLYNYTHGYYQISAKSFHQVISRFRLQAAGP